MTNKIRADLEELDRVASILIPAMNQALDRAVAERGELTESETEVLQEAFLQVSVDLLLPALASKVSERFAIQPADILALLREEFRAFRERFGALGAGV